MATYRFVGRNIEDMLAEAARVYRPDLVEAGVTIACLYAYPSVNNAMGKPTGPAILHHGYPAMALAKANSYRDRVEGKTDATILLDGVRFPDLPRPTQIAVLDHELWHFDLVREESGAIALDEALRPRLRIRAHDLELGIIVSVLERHGEHALELESIRVLHRMLSEIGLEMP